MSKKSSNFAVDLPHYAHWRKQETLYKHTTLTDMITMRQRYIVASLWFLLSFFVGEVSAEYAPPPVRQNQDRVSSNTQSLLFQSQQIMSPVSSYEGRVYSPFSNSSPADYSPSSPSHHKGNLRKETGSGGRTAGEATTGSNQSPVGEPWVMAVLAVLFGGLVALRQRRNRISETTENNTTMKDSINWKHFLSILFVLFVGVGQMWGYKRVVFLYQGWWVDEKARVEYADSEGAETWSWRDAVSLGNNWYYYDFPDWCTNMNFGRCASDNTLHNSQNYNNFSSQIYYINGADGSSSTTVTTQPFHSGFQGGNDDRWVKIGANGAETLIKPNSSTFDQNIGTTVNLYLKEFGAWTWKHNNYSSQYGNVGKMTLCYLLGKDGPGDQTDWHTISTDKLGDGENTKDGVTYQPWKWTGDQDLLSNLTTKTNLVSGTYYIKYYYSAYANRANNGACFEEVPYDRNGDCYFIHFTIPQPQVTISGRPYAEISSMVTAAPKSGTTIDGQTFQYQFETYNGSTWDIRQAYSSTTTFTYTPTSADNKVRVKMRVVETNEESEYVEQVVSEQYYIYVVDTRNWGRMFLHMENTDQHVNYLGNTFPGEELLPCDTINNIPVYRVALDTYFHRLWLSDGTNSNQTYNDGFLINFDLTGTYGIKKVHAGHWFQLVEGSKGAKDCYLKDYDATLYRVVSYDGATGKTYYSNAVLSTEDAQTVSFFANPAHGSSYVKVQTWSEGADTGGAANLDGTWSDGSTDYKSSLSSISATGTVFTATLSSGNLSDFAKYEGGYDLHPAAKSTTTKNFLTNGVGKDGTTGTQFVYFDPNASIFPNEKFNYYWVDWFETGANRSCVATVGNKYNSDLAGVISTDPYSQDGQIQSANGGNVRFGYNPNTNYFSRSIIAGSGNLIKIQGDNVTPSGGSKGAEGSFSDASSWVYTIAATVDPNATATVTTTYNGYAQTLTEDQKLIGGKAGATYNVLITYDFKTNRLLAAWKPDDSSFEGFDLSSNLMAVRTENGSPQVLNIQQSNVDDNKITLSGITKIYTALEFTYNNWVKAGGNADRRIVSGNYIDEYYWISLPYRCYVGDIFGIEGYGPDGSWVIQTYHGDYRAQQGWWAETDNWWYDLERTDFMEANQGYVLRVTNLNGENSASTGIPSRFPGGAGSSIFLYFPSYENNLSIALAKDGNVLASSITSTVPKHKCEVWRGRETNTNAGNPNYDRRVIDSNWNIIGSPSFNTAKIVEGDWSTGAYPASGSDALKADAPAFKYFYTWSAGTYTATSATGYEFKATHAYLVQYEGTITWQAYDSNNPLVVKKSPARAQEEADNQTLKLVLNRGTAEADVTYISRMEEGATEGYDLNMDLSKILSASGNNLYTIAGYYKMAGNCLPDTVKNVPMGVQIADEGEYTFALPEGTNGVGVVLVDKVANTRTNLALTDYTVNLTAGEINDRFSLELSPVSNVPTGIDNSQFTIDNSQCAVRKVLIDGVLYIVKDGKIYDARGRKIQD